MQGNSSFGFSGGGSSAPPPVNTSWLLDGNTNGALKYFGTNDNYGVPIYTNGVQIGVFTETGDFGFGINLPTARVHVKGVDATSSNFAFKSDNSASAPLLYVRNDGNVGISIALPTEKLQVSGNVKLTSFSDKFIINTQDALSITQSVGSANIIIGNGNTMNDASNGGGIVIGMGSTCTANGVSIGLNSIINIGAEDGIAIGRDARVFGFVIRGAAIGRQAFSQASGAWAIGNYCLATQDDTIILGNAQSGNKQDVGIAFATPSARLHVQGKDATSSNYSFKADNSASTALLYVRNDGVSLFNTNAIYATNFSYDVKIQLFSNPNSSNGNYFSLATGGGSILQATLSRRSSGVVKSELYFIESNDTTYLAIGAIGDADKALSLRTNDTNRLYITHSGNIGISQITPLAKMHIFGVDSTSVNLRLEPVTNVTEDTTGNTVNTSDATANVTAQTIAIPTNKVISLESTIVYRKTGGAGVGTTGDGTTLKLNSSVKNVAGTLTLDTVQNTYTGTVNSIAGVSVTYTVSGTNVLVSVTGVVNDDITWNVITKLNTVS